MAIDLDTNTLALLGIIRPVYIEGTSRGETISGNASSDYIKGLAGLDIINGGAGNDYIEGGTSPLGGLTPEILNGGEGNDTVGYINATGGVTVTLVALGTGVATGNDGLDTLLGFENVVGSIHNDTVNGGTDNNILMGMGADDNINGGGGNDVLYGGDGVDTIHGNQGDDKIYGEAGDDKLFGDDGDDMFYFSREYNAMDGGIGTDTVDYSGSPGLRGDATVNLKTGLGGHDAEGDTYVSIENVVGTNFNDDIWGNGSPNAMDGKGGSDKFFYDSIADLNGDRINQFFLSQGDRIDVTALGISANDIDESNIMPGRTVVYTIHQNNQTGSLTVQYGEVGVPADYQVFIF